MPDLTRRQATSLLAYEDMVVDEMAEVLQQNREDLVSKMGRRYQAFDKMVARNNAGQRSD